MKYLILRSFHYSTDGISSELFEKGDVKEIGAAHVSGLQAEGYIEPETEDAAGSKEPIELEPVVENAEGNEPEEDAEEDAAGAEEVPTTSDARPAKTGAKNGRR